MHNIQRSTCLAKLHLTGQLVLQRNSCYCLELITALLKGHQTTDTSYLQYSCQKLQSVSQPRRPLFDMHQLKSAQLFPSVMLSMQMQDTYNWAAGKSSEAADKASSAAKDTESGARDKADDFKSGANKDASKAQSQAQDYLKSAQDSAKVRLSRSYGWPHHMELHDAI